MKSAILICALVAGCVDAPDTSETSDNLLSANRLSSNALSANRLSSNRLSSNGLAAAASASTLDTLASDADGRQLLTYLVSCALPLGQVVVAHDAYGFPWMFAGSLGLAPGWYSGPPTVTERRWVSACLLARTNAFGISVPISMRGALPQLTASQFERQYYPQLEGNFFGDLWADDPRPMLTCESGFAATDPVQGWFPDRKCSDGDVVGDPTVCGFTYIGQCETTCIVKNGAVTCPDLAGTSWSEVIQVYLQR